MSLADDLGDIVDRAFDRSHEEYEEELANVNAELDLVGDLAFTPAVRPKFFTGDPEALTPGGYLLVVSLNHKYTRGPGVDDEIARLNAGPEEHYESCARYFDHAAYRFFTNFLPVALGMGFDRAQLGVNVFFMDALPFFSVRSRPLSVTELRHVEGTFVDLNREAVEAVITKVPPAALYLNGSTAFSAASVWSDAPVDWHARELRNRTAAGTCRVDTARVELFGTELWSVRSNFLRGINGPNSNEQLTELGQVLGGRDSGAEDADEPPNVDDQDVERAGGAWMKPRAGQTVRVWRPYGTFYAAHRGAKTYATSEKNRDAPDAVTPDENLVVTRVDGDNFFCKRRDGRTIRVHKNHLWRDAPYNNR